jgi:RNA polymerase sigma-70 factor, ECF subfamily
MKAMQRVHIMTPTLTNLTDDVLIKMALDGKAECFATLMDRHLLSVKRHIGSMVRNNAEVDDLVQEVLVKVWRNLSGFRGEAGFRTWMTRIAINEVLQSYRRRRPESRWLTPADLNTIASVYDTPYEHLVRGERTARVRNALACLPAKYRQVLLLREFESLSMRETARSIQASVPAVKSRLFRARVMLTGKLRQPKVRAMAT